MRIAFTWDDGATEDKRLIELHYKYEIPGMFFVPTENREGREVLSPTDIRTAVSPFIRFGGHTEHHTYLTTIPMEQIEDEVRENREKLSEWTGSAIEHFCMPGGAYTEEMLPTLYRNFRTLRTADTMNFHNPDRTFIRPTFHFYPRGKISMLGNALRHKSYDAFFYVLTHLTTGYFDIVRRLIRRYEDKDVDIVIWGHSWEIAELGLFPELEKLFHYLHIKYADKIVDYETLTSENK